MSGFLDYRAYPELVTLVDGLLEQWAVMRLEAVGVLAEFIKSPEVDIQNADDIRLFILPLKWQGQTVNAGHQLPYAEDMLERVPVTAGAIANPLVVSAMFSLSVPGCELTPHKDNEGWIGKVWRLHIGLDCPSCDCALIVDDERRDWANGEALLFDSANKIHSAFNRSNHPRLIFIVDIDRDAIKAEIRCGEPSL